ncbi:nuclear transport factor 2 family protein [Aestuariispira insulae]|uniref:SnoaL-like domain-containing protein n=1 Tax=Aestuariispira insulae TaxID=1461337 RepID=A0A3D9HY92_9PROT|nr:nuclear transport factor 2 family protein [Aestuariispira insulae]RED54331.1 hypothetical protein DFP90_1011134 [Aestuariispira insulae]
MTPEEIAQAQLDAYNAHDLEAFCACFHEHVTAELLVSGTQMLSGMEEFRKLYARRFSNPKLKAWVKHRITIGNVVVDHEEILGLSDDGPVEVIAIYETEGTKIRKVRFIREDI